MAVPEIEPQLQNILTNFAANAPEEVRNPITRSLTELQSSFSRSSTPQPGSQLPPFSLPNASGTQISSSDLLAKGPVLITFYRGSWCPFCNIVLHGLQNLLPEFTAKGVTLVAISPELPDQSLTLAEKHSLEFEVLSDVGNKYARELGIVWTMPGYLRPAFEKLGHDLRKWNGDDSFEVPVPATILVDKEGVVRNAFVEPDYTKRLEPRTALEWVESL